MPKVKPLSAIARKYPVVKANKYIQTTRQDLTLQEQRFIIYLCSLLPKDIEDVSKCYIDFDMSDYLATFRYTDSGTNYADLKKAILSLKTKSFFVPTKDGGEVTVDWISKAWVDKNKSHLRVQLDEDLVPYFCNLRDNFVSYNIDNIKELSCSYSIRLYELFKSYSFIKQKVIPVDQLRYMLDLQNKYPRFSEFEKRVLTPAVMEINKLTDITVSYEKQKEGKQTVSIILTIKSKDMLSLDSKKSDSNKKTQFHNFQERAYDYKELEEIVAAI